MKYKYKYKLLQYQVQVLWTVVGKLRPTTVPGTVVVHTRLSVVVFREYSISSIPATNLIIQRSSHSSGKVGSILEKP
jgi:hypothetical protein